MEKLVRELLATETFQQFVETLGQPLVKGKDDKHVYIEDFFEVRLYEDGKDRGFFVEVYMQDDGGRGFYFDEKISTGKEKDFYDSFATDKQKIVIDYAKSLRNHLKDIVEREFN